MTIYVDIDDTICYRSDKTSSYADSIPIYEHIHKINKLYDEGHYIIYWTARGTKTKVNWYDITKNQLDRWECKYQELITGEKPAYDLLICDKTKRIEEI